MSSSFLLRWFSSGTSRATTRTSHGSHRPVPVWIGRVSYGLYLWHWGLIVMLNHWMPWREAAAVALPLTFALTALSFQFVEEPCRRLRLSPGGRLASSQLAPVRDAA